MCLFGSVDPSYPHLTPTTMKTYTLTLLTALGIIMTGCNSSSGKLSDATHTSVTDAHEHDHDHSKEHEHSHDHDEGNCDHNHEEIDLTDAIEFSEAQAELIGLETETVTRGDFACVIKTSGQILPAQGDEITVVATSNGIVTFPHKSLTEGASIQAGQSLVTISGKKLLDGDPFVRAKAEYETALKEYERAEGLVQDKIISTKDFEQIRLRYETTKNAYQEQSTAVTPHGVVITAPISGFLKNRLVSHGEYVSVGQAIATVSQNRKLHLRAEVSERHYKAIRGISGANFRPSYDEGVYRLADLNGRLLSHGKDVGQSSFLIPVTFEFDNIGADFVPGSFAEVYLLGGSLSDVLSVPMSAITEEQGLHFVYVRLNEGHYRKLEVTLGQCDGNRVHILSGLNEGDEVVTRGVYQVKLAATSSVIPHGHSH